jgi:tetratricopeptide (TPR) repeat protein
MRNTETVVAESLRDARVALRSAWYDAALELLEGCEDWPREDAERAVVLKAEALGRREPVGALGYLASIADIPESDAGRFRYAVQLGKAHAAVRDLPRAESWFEQARALCGALPDGAHTLAFHDLRMRWFRRDFDPAAREFALAAAHPDPSIASSAYAVRAWLHAGRGAYRDQAQDLMHAVSYLTRPGGEQLDVAALATSTHALAQLAFETANDDAVALARTALETIAWTSDVRAAHYMTVRALGWDAFMRGRAAQAQWMFKDARALAPSQAWTVMAHLDRAYVARLSRNEGWAIEELAEAHRIARNVRWESCFDEQRQVLVVLAVLYAPVDAAIAQYYAATYSRIGTENVDPSLALSTDRRARAHAHYAQGRVDQTLGRHESAVSALRDAYEIFDSAEFRYRAALAATALAEVTGEHVWRDRALAHAAHYPDCPLAAAVDDAVAREEAMPAELTPLQRQIARALWCGAELSELSQRFSRSRVTIERNVNAVFAAFNVTTRGALLREARARGIA